MTPDPPDRGLDRFQVEHAASASAFWRSMRRCSGRAAPCTAELEQQQQQQQQQKLVSCGESGWVRLGTLQVRPCKLGRRIHAAHAPEPDPPPSTDFRDL